MLFMNFTVLTMLLLKLKECLNILMIFENDGPHILYCQCLCLCQDCPNQQQFQNRLFLIRIEILPTYCLTAWHSSSP